MDSNDELEVFKGTYLQCCAKARKMSEIFESAYVVATNRVGSDVGEVSYWQGVRVEVNGRIT